jgi:methylglutaconyl-CoA hydratase
MNSVDEFSKVIQIPAHLNPESISEILHQTSALNSENTKYIILKGENGRFCLGMDIHWLSSFQSETYTAAIQNFCQFLKFLQTSEFITIAVVSGEVAGGGMGIVTACDYVIADQGSTFSLPEGYMGLVPGIILPALLQRINQQNIKKMFLSGEKVGLKKALDWGIIDAEFTPTELEVQLSGILKNTRNCKKEAIGGFKSLMYSGFQENERIAELAKSLLLSRLDDPLVKERIMQLSVFLKT